MNQGLHGFPGRSPGALQPSAGLVKGRYYLPPSFVGLLASWSGLSTNTISWVRMPLGAAGRLAAMGISVQTASATALLRLGMYSDLDEQPDELLADFGAIDSSTTGFKEIAGQLDIPSPRWGWLCGSVTGTLGSGQWDTYSGVQSGIGGLTSSSNRNGYNGTWSGATLPQKATMATSFALAIRAFVPQIKVAG